MSKKLDINPGQVWIRRDGGKARIYATDGMGLYSIHGASKVKDGWRSMNWGASGNFYPIETDFDLIRLYDWREELAPIWAVLHPRFTWIAMDKDGNWFCYTNKPEQNNYRYLAKGGLRYIGDLFEMPTPDCPWYETLTMRPGVS